MKKLRTIISFLVIFTLVIMALSTTASAIGMENIILDEQPLKIELQEMRTENAKYFMLSDGSYSVEVYSYPVHCLNSDGEWVEIPENSDEVSTMVFTPPVDLGGDEGSGQTVRDTYICSDTPSTNYGSSGVVKCNSTNIAFFDTTLPGLPSYASVTSATMELNYYFATSYGNVTLGAYRILTDWSEGTVTWNTMSQYIDNGIYGDLYSSNTLYAAGTSASFPGSVTFDITQAAKYWYDAPLQYHHGIAIQYISGTTSSAVNFVAEHGTTKGAKFTFNYVIMDASSYNLGIRKTSIDGIVKDDYTKVIDDYFETQKAVCENNMCDNIMDVTSYAWFYERMKNGGMWDIKLESIWNAAFPNLPYQSNFVFRGRLITPEELGNIMYGYLGTAMRYGPITLYWGGGVAHQQTFNSPELNVAPFYGDDENDHWSITDGINMFWYDYPNYSQPIINIAPPSNVVELIAPKVLNMGI